MARAGEAAIKEVLVADDAIVFGTQLLSQTTYLALAGGLRAPAAAHRPSGKVIFCVTGVMSPPFFGSGAAGTQNAARSVL
jgi:ABC-type sugar transport system substrate-binding protein